MVSLQERLIAEMKEAMRKGDRTKVSVIRFLRSAIGYEEIDKRHTLDDQEVAEVIFRQVKQRRESIEQFGKGGRRDLVEKEQVELEHLQLYLPAELTHEELREMALRVMTEVGAQGLQDKGKVMGRLMSQVEGKADGSQVNEMVAELLSSSP